MHKSRTSASGPVDASSLSASSVVVVVGFGVLGSVAAWVLPRIGAPLWVGVALILLAGTPALAHWARCVASMPGLPRRPRYVEPRLRVVGPEPPSTVLERSDRCVICGRTLTNLQSQYARVGTDCIKRYGPRYNYIPNPDHGYWMQDRTRAEVELASARAHARVLFEKEMANYHRELDRMKSSPALQETLAKRKRAVVHLRSVVAGWVLALMVFALLVL